MWQPSRTPIGLPPTLPLLSLKDSLAKMEYYRAMSVLGAARSIWFIDTETTGLPPRRVSPKCVDAWAGCRVVQLAWRVYTTSATLLETGNFIVNPEGAFVIPEEAARIHGIDTATATERGVSFGGVLVAIIDRLVADTTLVVAHNTEFDVNVLAAELMRNGREDLVDRLLALPAYCTMKRNTRPGQRWPRLRDLYVRVFGREPDGTLHDADTDVRLCSDIYFATVAAPSDSQHKIE